ncbi:YciI family protein [Dinghuibacter silviterrae]|uniref:YciI family protein n=1 Tax=Dinghuibacter silviterrae TaxID=1539049 RepID=UPI001064228D|nr:YciI family protein [Dinghuibacter silviterrae]
MQEFMLVFRQSTDAPLPTPEQLAAVSPVWEHWMGGYIVVKAADLEEATTLAHGCPILLNQGTVEIRPIDAMR